MKLDKTKVILFATTLVFLATTLLFAVLFINEKKTVTDLKGFSTPAQEVVQKEQTSLKEASLPEVSDVEILLKDFYSTVYNYEKSPKEVDLSAIKDKLSETVYQDLQNEIQANTLVASPQQNRLQKSVVKRETIKLLAYRSEDSIDQYLVTIPIEQVVNGVKNDFDLQQIVQIKDKQIITRQEIQLNSE